MNREQLMHARDCNREIAKLNSSVRLAEETKKLIEYFNADGYSRFGFAGDADGLSPVGTAIRALREYDRLLGTAAGSQAQVAMLHNDLVEKGLVPA